MNVFGFEALWPLISSVLCLLLFPGLGSWKLVRGIFIFGDSTTALWGESDILCIGDSCPALQGEFIGLVSFVSNSVLLQEGYGTWCAHWGCEENQPQLLQLVTLPPGHWSQSLMVTPA